MSWTKPTDKDVEGVLAAVGAPQQEAYFFERLNNPLWIEPLVKHKAFAYPPPTQSTPDGGMRFPIWPRSRYLARMAKEAPEPVANVLASLQTDNPSVLGDVISAATAMPSAMAERLAPIITAAAKAGQLWVYFDDAVGVCLHLAQGGQLSASLELFRAMFEPTNKRTQDERRDEYWYKEGLKRITPVLARATPQALLEALSGWLSATIIDSTEGAAASGDDASWFWRPAIEEHEQNHDVGFRSVLAGALRAACEEAIAAGSITLDEALATLQSHHLVVFRRMSLYLVAQLAPEGSELARAAVLDKSLFDDHRMKHEYVLLLRRHFHKLRKTDAAEWLAWVDSGPNLSDFEELRAAVSAPKATADDRNRYVAYWKFAKLHPIREHLTGATRRFYESMLAEHGEPLLTDMNVGSSVHWGHGSPMTVEQLAAHEFETVVHMVSTWRPRAGTAPWDSSVDGLLDTFRQYLGNDLSGASKKAAALIGAPQAMVRAYLSRMTQGVKDGLDVDIAAVLDLCQWVVAQPIDAKSPYVEEHGPLIDRDWRWCRDECARFAETYCNGRRNPVTADDIALFRQRLWNVLDSLQRDPLNSYLAEDDSKRDPVTTDYISMSLNSSRGIAVSAGLAYAHWVGRHLAVHENGVEVIPGGLEGMPEVRAMLEWHIGHPSIQASASVGLRAGLLHWLDGRWFAANSRALFDIGPDVVNMGTPAGWAAWNSFVIGARAHVVLYHALREQFALAVKQASVPRPLTGEGGTPQFHLAEFLMLLYGRGDLGLDEDEGVVRRLLDTALPTIRRHAIEFVGRTLRNDDDVPPEVIARFTALWEMYWAGKGISDSKEKPGAMLFGQWFATGRFEPEWALAQLAEFVEVAGLPEPDDAVVERLAELVDSHVSQVMDLLKRMVEADVEGWHVHGWGTSTQVILRRALREGGAAQSSARGVINTLGRRGYVEFGKLLKE